MNLYFNKTYTRFENLLAPLSHLVSPKARTVYRCTNCGADHPKWAGRCDVCGEWNSLVEEMATSRASPRRRGVARRRAEVDVAKAGASRRSAAPRREGLAEPAAEDRNQGIRFRARRRNRAGLDGARWRRAGNRQIHAAPSGRGEAAGARASDAVRLGRGVGAPGEAARRAIGDGSARDVALLSETLLETILATAARSSSDAIVVDSIQTVFTSDLEGAPGNVGQVRECAARLMRFAKETETTVFAVGHVTKGGGIAGPKTLEHIVDTVLYFEGEGMLEHRILRATKNRFGSVDEIGVFRMTEEGLIAVENPSELFLGDRLE